MAGRKGLLLTAAGLLLAAAFPLRLRQQVWIFGSVSVLDLFLLLTPFWLVLANLRRPHRLPVGNAAIAAVLLLPVPLGALSLLWSENPNQTLYYLAQSLLAMAAYLAAVNLLQGQTPQVIMRLAGGFLTLVLATAFLSFARLPGFAPDTFGMVPGSREYLDYLVSYYTRLSHPFWGLSNAFAGVLVFFVPLFIGWGLYRHRRWPLLLAGATLVAICLSLSRGAILAVLVALAVSLLCWPRGRRRGSVATGLAALVTATGVLWLVALGSPLAREHILLRLTGSTVETRLEQFALALRLIREAPLLGHGAGVVPRGQELLAGGVHNTFLQAIMELGLPLGLTFLFLLFALAGLLLLRRGPFARTEPTMTVAVGGGLLAALLVFMTQAQFEGVVLRSLFYLGMGLAAALLAVLPAASGPAAGSGKPGPGRAPQKEMA